MRGKLEQEKRREKHVYVEMIRGAIAPLDSFSLHQTQHHGLLALFTRIIYGTTLRIRSRRKEPDF